MQPTLAQANVGIGFFMLALPFVVVALLPAVPIEAFVLHRFLRVPSRRALSLSLRANVWSTLLGLALGVGIDLLLGLTTGSSGPEPTKVAASFMLIPFLVLSWWIERVVIVRRAAELPRRRVTLAAGAANLLSYSLMLAAVWLTALHPTEGTLVPRAVISEGLSTAYSVRIAVEEFYVEHKRLPKSVDELEAKLPDREKFVITLNQQSRVIVRMITPNLRDIHEKSVVLTPTITTEGAERNVRWVCSSSEIPQRMLPYNCRDRNQ